MFRKRRAGGRGNIQVLALIEIGGSLALVVAHYILARQAGMTNHYNLLHNDLGGLTRMVLSSFHSLFLPFCVPWRTTLKTFSTMY